MFGDAGKFNMQRDLKLLAFLTRLALRLALDALHFLAEKYVSDN